MYTKTEKKTLLSYLNKVKKFWKIPDDIVDIDYIESNDTGDWEGYILHIAGVASVLFYIDTNEISAGVRFNKVLPAEKVAIFTIDLCKIIPNSNVFVYDGFYYDVSGELVFGEAADKALWHEIGVKAVESYIKEISDQIFSPTETGKIYRC